MTNTNTEYQGVDEQTKETETNKVGNPAELSRSAITLSATDAEDSNELKVFQSWELEATQLLPEPIPAASKPPVIFLSPALLQPPETSLSSSVVLHPDENSGAPVCDSNQNLFIHQLVLPRQSSTSTAINSPHLIFDRSPSANLSKISLHHSKTAAISVGNQRPRIPARTLLPTARLHQRQKYPGITPLPEAQQASLTQQSAIPRSSCRIPVRTPSLHPMASCAEVLLNEWEVGCLNGPHNAAVDQASSRLASHSCAVGVSGNVAADFPNPEAAYLPLGLSMPVVRPPMSTPLVRRGGANGIHIVGSCFGEAIPSKGKAGLETISTPLPIQSLPWEAQESMVVVMNDHTITPMAQNEMDFSVLLAPRRLSPFPMPSRWRLPSTSLSQSRAPATPSSRSPRPFKKSRSRETTPVTTVTSSLVFVSGPAAIAPSDSILFTKQVTLTVTESSDKNTSVLNEANKGANFKHLLETFIERMDADQATDALDALNEALPMPLQVEYWCLVRKTGFCI